MAIGQSSNNYFFLIVFADSTYANISYGLYDFKWTPDLMDRTSYQFAYYQKDFCDDVGFM